MRRITSGLHLKTISIFPIHCSNTRAQTGRALMKVIVDAMEYVIIY